VNPSPQTARRLRVTVLRGGPGPERAVSLASGEAVAAALRRRGHQVFEADIGPDNLAALDHAADVVFPALHGTFGEDGVLQAILGKRGVRFVGSDSRASALAMDKVAAKEVAAHCGVRTPAYEVWTATEATEPRSHGATSGRDRATQGPRDGGPERQRGTRAPSIPCVESAVSGTRYSAAGCARPLPDDRRAAWQAQSAVLSPPCPPLTPGIPLPVVVKPVDQGSSVATFIVREAEQFAGAVREVVGQFGRALVEQFVEGDEVTVGILGRQPLPPICIRPKQTFYDYKAKYEDDATEYLFDAGHPTSLLDRARQQSLAVFTEIGCRHLARVDWIADRRGELWFLELNTIPGFTSHSLVPKAAAYAGISFEELVERLVLLALAETT
jgi:D-alanine-D-alanine ligase-like ATP-grasp enzyme